MTQAEIPATTRGLLPGDTQAVPVTLVTTGDWAVVESGLEPAQRSFAQAIGFTPKAVEAADNAARAAAIKGVACSAPVRCAWVPMPTS